jgi:hypothetical protein
MQPRWRELGRALFPFGLTVLLMWPTMAHSQGPRKTGGVQDQIQAEQLFRDGKKLFHEKRYEEACPKLKASYDLDEGIGALGMLANCQEKLGKIASAWSNYLAVAAKAKAANQPDREKIARERAKDLEKRLMRLSVMVPANNVVPDLQIIRDGSVEIVQDLWGSAVPVDPGEHTIVAKAKGYLKWTKTFKVSVEGATETITVPKLEIDPTPPPDTTASNSAVVPPPPPPTTTVMAPPPPREDPGANQRTWGFVIGGVGLVGVTIGSILGVNAITRWDEAGCKNGLCATQAKKDTADQAKKFADFSTVAFVIGGIAVAGGLTMILTAPSASSGKESPTEDAVGLRELHLAPAFGPNQAGMMLGGSFH